MNSKARHPLQTFIPPLPALNLIGSTRFIRVFSYFLVLAFALLIVGVIFSPWRQFVRGAGKVIAFDPLDRRINVEAQVAGTIKHLHIVEGQVVAEGDVIAEIQDNDPNLIENLKLQRTAIKNRHTYAIDRVRSLDSQIQQQQLAMNRALESARQTVSAANIAAKTAQLEFNRTTALFDEGLASRRAKEQVIMNRDSTLAALRSAEAALERTKSEYEATIASIKAQRKGAQSDIAQAERDLSSIDIQINQNERQIVRAPKDGIVLQVAVTDGTYLKPGSLICVMIPKTDSRFVEVWLDGNDVPLLKARREEGGETVPGSSVRLAFEGWPAVQTVGWPQLAVGTFSGEVIFIDATDDGAGRFRVVVGPSQDHVNRYDEQGIVTVEWPDKDRWLRQGVQAKAWFLLEEVPLWFELWRQINGFPPLIKNDATLDPTVK